MCSARRKCGSSTRGACGSLRATTRSSRTRPARPSSRCAARRSSPNRRSACRSIDGSRRRPCSTASIPGGGTTRREGRASVLFCYSFGKAQRILAGVDSGIGPIFCHGAVEPLNRAYRAAGVALPPTRLVSDIAARDKAAFKGALVSRRRPRRAARGCAASATTAMRSRPAGCGCAARGGVAGWIAASSCPITPTGPACKPRSARRGPNA